MTATFLLGLRRIASLAVVLLVVSAACGVSPQGLVSTRVIVTAIVVSEDGQRVESIDIRTADGEELTLELSDGIDPAAWSPEHLQGHVGAGQIGIQIGVKYSSDSMVATELFE